MGLENPLFIASANFFSVGTTIELQNILKIKSGAAPSAPPVTQQDAIMGFNNIRLSRISHPRATFWAMALLIIVFVGFGIWAEASLPGLQTQMLIPDAHIHSQGWLQQLVYVFH